MFLEIIIKREMCWEKDESVHAIGELAMAASLFFYDVFNDGFMRAFLLSHISHLYFDFFH